MKFAAAVLSGASIVALSLAVATPAYAAGNAIDPGDSLYAINCDEEMYNDWQFFSVDSTTAVSTPIGTGEETGPEESSGCAGQPAYNPATGKSYYIQWTQESVDLASIDVTTGVSTTIGGFYYDNGEFPEYVEADALAIGADGAAYVLAEGTLWSVNLDTAWVTPIGETEPNIYAFAYDSVTSKFYGITYLNAIYEIDVTDGTATYIDDVVGPDPNPEALFRIYSLQFDEAGTFWVEIDTYVDEEFVATLWSFTLATVDAPVYSGIFTDDPFYTEALLIIPGDPAVEPALAATGADVADVLPWGVGAAAIVLAGGVLMIVRSRRGSAASAE